MIGFGNIDDILTFDVDKVNDMNSFTKE